MFSKERVRCNRYRMSYLVYYYEVQLANSHASVIKQPRALNFLDNRTPLKFHSQLFSLIDNCKSLL